MYDDQAKQENLYGQLMNGVVTSVQSETMSKEAENIRSAVLFYLMKWLDVVEEINPLFKVKELIGVGSYAEGTKIIEPNEFDYLAVIDNFSKPGLLSIDRKESNFNEGLVKVKVKDDNLKSRCSQLCKNGHLQCFQPINFPDLGEHRFGHVFLLALKKFVKKTGLQMGQGTGSPTCLSCRIHLPTINNISLLFGGADYNAPNVLIYFKYKGRKLTTDISPAIRYYQPEDCFQGEDSVSPVFADLVLSRKSLLLIGTQHESDFRITVTEAEVEYIKRMMKPEHKIIYIFLKYITKLYTDIYTVHPFTSYMLKTVCFHHDARCEVQKISIRHCFESVIEDLMVCTQQGFVISILDKHIHLKSINVGFLIYEYRTSMLTDIKKMCILPEGIKTVDAFHEFVGGFALKEKQKRDKESDDKRKRRESSEDRFYENIQREVSKLTDMGFGTEEAEVAMKRALDDPALALLILKFDAERRKDKTIIESDVILPEHRQRASDLSCVPSDSTDASISSIGESLRDTIIQHNCSTTISEEIIYERQKH